MLLEDAKEADYPEIIRLVNAAYRGTGDSSAQSWNQEVGILKGTRTDDSLLCEEASARAHVCSSIAIQTTAR